ncbi:nucleotide-binding universal stress UspA family protein [Motilibacter peucedani]|uniref:Nucleotide-binding universal stress UspA family protein n=1 Tax=Motilibacter peucedani TaxID=598650 RepID=A0A420XVH8_9ACTN|nr:universal stress protein [Motilibacter peucedani]RKS84271.1 nucleotide-binding universal stress UspA family protein [Motilibacter peucedani]
MAGSVLAGIRGDDSDPVVLRAAVGLSRRLYLPLLVAHVVQVPSGPAAGAEALARLATDVELDLVVRLSALLDACAVRWSLAVTAGDACARLRSLAEEHDAAVIVVGTQGSGPRCALRRLVHGSVSARLIHQQPRPVLVVPTTGTPAPGGSPVADPFGAPAD